MSNAGAPLAGKRGLVLEDEFLIALDLEELLQAAGAEVTAVARIDQALAALRDNGPWDFGILDQHLGSTTSASVAAAFVEQNIPFVFLTGSRQGEAGQALSSAPTVEKPYQPDALINAIRRLLDKR